MDNQVKQSPHIVYLNKNARKRRLYKELVFLFVFLVISFFLYISYSSAKILLVLLPVGLLIIAKFLLFLRNNKALVLYNGKLYVCRSGFVARKEMEKVYIAETKGVFSKKQRCIFFDLDTGRLYEPTYFEDWSLYALPSTIIAVCESDVDAPLDDLLRIIKTYIK